MIVSITRSSSLNGVLLVNFISLKSPRELLRNHTNRQTKRLTNRQTDRQADTQTDDRLTDAQTDTQIDRQRDQFGTLLR